MVKPIPKRLLIHTISVEPLTSEEGWEKTYGDPETISNVRVEPKKTLQRSNDEYSIVGDLIVYMDYTHTTPFKVPKKRDRITFYGDQYTVEGTNIYYGVGQQIHHVEVVMR